MSVATEVSVGLPELQFYDLPDTSTLHIYWRAIVNGRIHKRAQYRIKRAFDIVAASILLLVLSPVFGLAALLVKATSRGPVLFRQQRLMQSGDEFTLLKFRTMVDGADGMLDKVFHLNEAKGPLFKARKDPRCTPVGRILRKTFIDELPQLVNVLRGEMSLVGPRPILAREVAGLPGRVVFRLSVPQGITGPWQIGGHHKLTFEQQLEAERHYIEDWSLRRDFVILFQTVALVLAGKGL